MFRATEPVGLSLLEHASRLTIALTTATGNKQNPALLDIGEARKICQETPLNATTFSLSAAGAIFQ